VTQFLWIVIIGYLIYLFLKRFILDSGDKSKDKGSDEDLQK